MSINELDRIVRKPQTDDIKLAALNRRRIDMKLAAKVQEWITSNEWNDKISYDFENQTSSVSFIYIINEQPFKAWVETYENKTNAKYFKYLA